MLGNHSHILLSGGTAYLTGSLGLGWRDIQAPEDINRIAIDGDGNLLAVSVNQLWRWNWADESWSVLAQLPIPAQVDDLLFFNGRVFLAVGGRVFSYARTGWGEISLSQEGYITDLAYEYPDTLWALDARTATLWSSQNGVDWDTTVISLRQ